MENLQPPGNLNDLISINFGSLQTYLTYLIETDKKLLSDMFIISTENGNTKKTIKDVSSKTERLETKLANTENSLFSVQAKFADLENKIVSTLKRNEDGHSIVINKLNVYEDNLNKLNRLTEDNIKNVTKLETSIESYTKENVESNKKSEDYEKRLEKYEKCLDVLAEKYDKIKIGMDEEINRVKMKITESDVRILKVTETINGGVPATPDIRSVGGGGRRLSYTTNQFPFPIAGLDRDNNPNSPNNLILSEISKLNKEIDNLKKKSKENDEVITSLCKTNEELIERVTKLKHGNSEEGGHHQTSTPTNSMSNTRSLLRTNSINTENVIGETLIVQNKSLAENLTKMNDNVKSLNINVNMKLNKEEFNNFSNYVNTEFDKFSQIYTDNFKSIDLRIQNLITASKMLSSNPSSGGSGNIIINRVSENSSAPEELEEVVTKISKNVISSELSENKKIIENFLQTNLFQDLKIKLDQNKEEIDKLYDSIVDIRKNCLDTKKDDENETVMIMKPRLQNIENNITRLRSQIEEVSRNVEGEFENHLKETGDTSNMRDFVRNIGGGMKNLSEKVETVVSKQTNLNQEIIMRVKKDLANESSRILDEFRMDLKQSIGMIEDKLKEKVDRFGLDEFGRKIDNKFHNQINRKIDISDLRKNNNLIVKKIDTLENKISKTLVDTLIDLQMEEAPLIVKKSMNGEKCASCNQIIPTKDHLNHYSLYHSAELQFSDKHLRPPLITPKHVDTTESERQNKTTSYTLPDVKKKKANGVLKTDEQTEKELNVIIESELEKSIVKPENLIKTTNKLFNKFEKKIK
jgi:hypothetical protein